MTARELLLYRGPSLFEIAPCYHIGSWAARLPVHVKPHCRCKQTFSTLRGRKVMIGR
jgi:hypothetical protein